MISCKNLPLILHSQTTLQVKSPILVKHHIFWYNLGFPNPLIGNQVKHLLILLSILLFSFTYISCSRSSDGGSSNTSTTTDNDSTTDDDTTTSLLTQKYSTKQMYLYRWCSHNFQNPSKDSQNW